MQMTSLRERTHVASELFFFYVELWAENTNPQHRHNPFAISKINFSEKLYIRQKILHESMRLTFWLFSILADFGRSQFIASKVVLEF